MKIHDKACSFENSGDENVDYLVNLKMFLLRNLHFLIT